MKWIQLIIGMVAAMALPLTAGAQRPPTPSPAALDASLQDQILKMKERHELELKKLEELSLIVKESVKADAELDDPKKVKEIVKSIQQQLIDLNGPVPIKDVLKEVQQQVQDLKGLLPMKDKFNEIQKKFQEIEDPVTKETVKALNQSLHNDDGPVANEKRHALQKNIDYVWIVTAGVLVFFMQTGFSLLEMGFVRAKNCLNAMVKGLTAFCSCAIAFLLSGFVIMFGTSQNGLFGTFHWMPSFGPTSSLWNIWFFELVFAACATVIASGAMAERTRFLGYMIYTAVFGGLLYPIFGHWAWGDTAGGFEAGFGGDKGWLQLLGFHDFAGGTVVHVIGGACALAGIMVVGPRVGRFAKDGSPISIPPHNLAMAIVGCLILWVGWMGFNGGSTLLGDASIGRVVSNTILAASAGALFSMVIFWKLRGVADVGVTINGVLGGLVAITPCSDCVSTSSALILGAVAGFLATIAAILLEKWHLDDVAGAVPVHLVCGVWGTLCVALFNDNGCTLHAVGIQALGTFSIGICTFISAFLLFKIIDVYVGLRASDEMQEMGLDFGEHSTNAYPDFTTEGR